MDITEFEIDVDAIELGAWRPAVGLKGVEFHLRGANNSDWDVLHDKLKRELTPAEKFAEVLPKEAAERITCELLLGACLLDWRGVTDKGADVPFSKETARKFLSERRFRKFRMSVLETAAKFADETVAERDAAAKN